MRMAQPLTQTLNQSSRATVLTISINSKLCGDKSETLQFLYKKVAFAYRCGLAIVKKIVQY